MEMELGIGSGRSRGLLLPWLLKHLCNKLKRRFRVARCRCLPPSPTPGQGIYCWGLVVGKRAADSKWWQTCRFLTYLFAFCCRGCGCCCCCSFSACCSCCISIRISSSYSNMSQLPLPDSHLKLWATQKKAGTLH